MIPQSFRADASPTWGLGSVGPPRGGPFPLSDLSDPSDPSDKPLRSRAKVELQLSDRRVATKQLPRCNKAIALLHLIFRLSNPLIYNRIEKRFSRPVRPV